jgi:hypothetical protein
LPMYRPILPLATIDTIAGLAVCSLPALHWGPASDSDQPGVNLLYAICQEQSMTLAKLTRQSLPFL